MTEIAGRVAVVTGGGSGMGRELGPPTGGGSLQCRNVRRLADRLGGNAKALRGGGIAARATRHELRSKMEYALQLESSSRDRAVHFDLRPLSFADEGHRSINFGSQNP
jgi:hypothetical protein